MYACRSINKLQNDIIQYAVILVQEPWTVNNNVAGLSAYNMQQFGSRDVTVVCITYHCNGKKNTILVASVYMPIDSRLPPMPMEELLKYSEDTRIPAIVASDMNAHHHAWGSNDCNQRGTTSVSSSQQPTWK